MGKTQDCTFYQAQIAQLKMSKEIQTIVSLNQSMCGKNEWILFLDELDKIYANNRCNVRMDNILAIGDNDLILSAVDFHCSNMLQSLCANGTGKCWQIIMSEMRNSGNVMYDVEGYLKTMVWEYRSSLTDKIGLLMNESKRMDLMELWEKVKPFVNDFSLKYYRSRRGRRW